MNVSLTFTPDGTGSGLYTEAIDLSRIGELHVARATSIEFDNRTQHWRVRDLDGSALFSNPARQKCLAWERRHLDEREENKHQGDQNP